MGITVKHGKPSTIIKAAKQAGQARASDAFARQAMTNAARLQEKQMELDYRVALRQQDDAMDLEMQGRAKLWEMEKMELRSRGDFTREEQKRQRALDQYEASVKYIDDSDLFDERQKEGLKFKASMKLLNQNISGVDKILFPTEGVAKQVTPGQRMSAMKRLREETFQEPTRWQKFVPEILGGRPSELSPEIQTEKAFLQNIAAGQYTPPAGTITSMEPIHQENKRTGQKRVSYDGGETWQIL